MGKFVKYICKFKRMSIFNHFFGKALWRRGGYSKGDQNHDAYTYMQICKYSNMQICKYAHGMIIVGKK